MEFTDEEKQLLISALGSCIGMCDRGAKTLFADMPIIDGKIIDKSTEVDLVRFYKEKIKLASKLQLRIANTLNIKN